MSQTPTGSSNDCPVDDVSEIPGHGVAYVGSLCKRPYNVGSNAYDSAMWRTVAHELGHNFNALHPKNYLESSSGIMGYTDGKIGGEYMFDEGNRQRMCSKIASTLSNCDAVDNDVPDIKVYPGLP